MGAAFAGTWIPPGRARDKDEERGLRIFQRLLGLGWSGFSGWSKGGWFRPVEQARYWPDEEVKASKSD
jgi:hypothetical protein